MKNIGKRAAKEIYNRIDQEHSLNDVLDEINLTRASLCYWQNNGHVPSGKTLRRMALAGYDVHYILTGVKNNGKQIS